jgi:spermidine synthase
MTHMDEVARETSERGELVLRRREDGTLELRANGVFVMDTVEVSTERELATRALALHRSPARVLVGGLGLGFTLAAVLADPRVARATVVELEPALVGWLRAGVVPHGPGLLADPRVEVVVADVAAALREAAPAAYDLVLLDVDNGPGYLVHDANAGLYEAASLHDARRATAPGGMVVVWSAAEAPALADALRRVYGDVEPLPYAVDLQGRAETYWLYASRVTSDS